MYEGRDDVRSTRGRKVENVRKTKKEGIMHWYHVSYWPYSYTDGVRVECESKQATYPSFSNPKIGPRISSIPQRSSAVYNSS